MKKRTITLLTALMMLVCLLCVPSTATEPETSTFQAGYAIVDITPSTLGLPMSGYDSEDRVSTGIENNLYVACIALTDPNGTTVLFISVDTMNSNQQWSNAAKTAITDALGEEVVDADRIFINASGTMSCPTLVYGGTDEAIKTMVDSYRQDVCDKIAEAAVAAMADRCEVTIEHRSLDTSAAIVEMKALAGETVTDGDKTTRLNYNAHHKITDSNGVTHVAGANFGPSAYINNKNYTVEEFAIPDDTMGLLAFTPVDGSKDPILLANWSALPNLCSTRTLTYGTVMHTKIASDYVGYFRDALVAQNIRPAFFQGTSGNISAFNWNSDKQDPEVKGSLTYTDEEGTETTVDTVRPDLYGAKLAAVASYGLTQPAQTIDSSSTINTLKVRFAVEPSIPSQEEIDLINTLKQTDAPIIDADPENPEAEVPVYSNLYTYLLENWSKKDDYVETYPALAGIKELDQFSGIATRMRHICNPSSTNFATDSVFCDTTMLKLGDLTFVMASANLYGFYGELDNPDSKDWGHVGADYVLGNTNGASGYLPNAASYHYNEDSDTYAPGTNITRSTIFPEGAGERLMETYINMRKSMEATPTLACECAGQAEGKPGHVCQDIEWLPWYDPDSLPIGGHYYLETDVVLYEESHTLNEQLSLDLKGHTITRMVLPEIILDETLPAENVFYYQNTRLFATERTARLTITDSVGGGTLTRDISALDAISLDEQKKITNYGLLLAIMSSSTDEIVVYNAILDATGMYSQGGACVANMSPNAGFTMYNGTMKAGISDRGAAIYSSSTINLYGGSITGGQALDTSDEGDTAERNGNVYVVSNGKLLLAGNATISGGKDAEGNDNNVSISTDHLIVDPAYEGSAGITVRTNNDLNGTLIGNNSGATDALLESHFTIDGYPTYNLTTCESRMMVAEIREYCECGGVLANGEHGHTENIIRWKPWPYSNYLPSASLGGSYYLIKDITVTTQRLLNAQLNLDLNGFDITHKVQPVADPEKMAEANTRVFSIGAEGGLTITDSTNTPGTLTRDLSLWSEEHKKLVENYGLLVLISETAGNDFKLYNGILDATGMYSGGGACVANLSKDHTFYMYGGELKGGISRSAGVLYSNGPVVIYDGSLHGGQGAPQSTGTGGILIVTRNEMPGSLEIHADVKIYDNFNASGNPSNIRVNNGYEHFTVVGQYTGIAGVTLTQAPYEGLKVGLSENANIDGATVTVDNYPGCEIVVDGEYLVIHMDAAYITYEDETPVSYHKTLADAFEKYPGGKATITLQRDVAENDLTIDGTTYLNLKGFDIANTGFTATGNLYVFDSETDDYTIANGNGYGIMTGDMATAAEGLPLNSDIVTAVKPTDEYLKIVENETDVSFHRLNLRIAGISLRASDAGLYYSSQFGGDEVIVRNIVSYGLALGANETPSFREKTYTAIDPANWKVGADKKGNSNNLSNGTLLDGIVKTTNTYSVNSRNSKAMVNGLAYVELADGTRVYGPMASYSLRDVFEGNNITGVDATFSTLIQSQQTSILEMFNTYQLLMKNWNIPNIIAASKAADSEA